MRKRVHTTVDRPPLVETPGLVEGRAYRRVTPTRSIIPGYMPEDGWPEMEFVRPLRAGDKYEGLGGWFKRLDGTGVTDFALEADVEEVDTGGLTAADREEQACLVEGCETKKYSQSLCTKHYGRARKMVKDEGASWDDARKEVGA